MLSESYTGLLDVWLSKYELMKIEKELRSEAKDRQAEIATMSDYEEEYEYGDDGDSEIEYPSDDDGGEGDGGAA